MMLTMDTTGAVAPDLQDMSPLRRAGDRERSGFPVYKDLQDVLRQDNLADRVRKIPRALATCSGYSYSDAATLSMMMARMGLERNRCLEISQSVDAMAIASTSFLVQSRDGKVVVLSYRGTRPEDLINWLAITDIGPDKIRLRLPQPHNSAADATVHAGFYRNVRATRYKVLQALEYANGDNKDSVLNVDHWNKQLGANGESVEVDGPLEALYITGHSLGGAMAVLMAIMLYQSDYLDPLAAKLKGVYTFGQPMLGDQKLAAACDEMRPVLRPEDEPLSKKVSRYIYENDFVPQLPPVESGPFQHFGSEYRYDDKGTGSQTWHEVADKTGWAKQANIPEVANAFLEFVTEKTLLFRGEQFSASLIDHYPQHYISALTEPGGATEYGDTAAGVVVRRSKSPEEQKLLTEKIQKFVVEEFGGNQIFNEVVGKTVDSQIHRVAASTRKSIARGIKEAPGRIVHWRPRQRFARLGHSSQ